MEIQEIIEQEIVSFNAKKVVEGAIKKSKSEFLMPFAMIIFDFLESINNDPKFLFSSGNKEYAPLFSDDKSFQSFGYIKEKGVKSIESNAYCEFAIRSISSNSRWITLGVDKDFKPYVAFSYDFRPKSEESIFSADEAIRIMTRFFLEKRKK